MDVFPAHLPLGENDTCSCSNPREVFNTLGTTFERQCTIYALTHAFHSMITLQKCSKCTHRSIGPECSSLGIFNFNNTSLFTHELLDDYTSAFSSSETPFVSWVQTVSRRYQTRRSTIPFANEKLFRSSWFSYIRLVEFQNDMTCPKCGPNPDATIWDGVSVAFSRRNLMPSLCPPTTQGITSVSRPDVCPVPNLQPIPSRSIRLTIRSILIGPRLTTISKEDFPTESAEFDRNRKLVERLAKIPDLVAKLSSINVNVGGLFNTHFGLDAILAKRDAHDVYVKFFVQVRYCIIEDLWLITCEADFFR